MNRGELDGCLRLLAGYWPGEWDTDRVAVWADALAAYDAGHAREVIRAMSRIERFPTVAAFMAAARRPRLTERSGEIDEPRADPATAARHLATARAALHRPSEGETTS